MKARVLYVLYSIFLLVSSDPLDYCSSPGGANIEKIISEEERGGVGFYISLCGNSSFPLKDCEGGIVCAFQEDEVLYALNPISKRRTMDGYNLNLQGESPCPFSTDFPFIVIIQFVCDYGLFNDKISLLDDHSAGQCLYVFMWFTHRVCPRRSHHSHNNFEACNFFISEKGHNVSLKSMANPNGAYNVVASPNRMFHVNICSKVNSNFCSGSAFCMTSSDKSSIFDLGFSFNNDFDVTSYYGVRGENITLKYESPKASIIFDFFCVDEGDTQVVLASEKVIDEKDYVIFRVNSRKVCPTKIVDCTFKTSENFYDFRSLMSTEWTAHNLSISICMSNPNCAGKDQVICSRDGNLFATLGDDSLFLQNQEKNSEEISLRYSTNRQCVGEKNGTIEFLFECHDIDLKPSFLTSVDECNYYFLWPTTNVCKRSDEDVSVVSQKVAKSCLLKNGQDFSGLYDKRGDIIIPNETGSVAYAINICGEGLFGGRKGSCGSTSAICLLNKKATVEDRVVPKNQPLNGISIGENDMMNVQISQDDIVTLSFNSRTKCTKNKNMSSLIIFYCNRLNGRSHPALLFGNDSCITTFLWTTDLMCQEKSEVPCFTKDTSGAIIDLSLLSMPSDNYIKDDSNRTFVLNVCRTLEPSALHNCPTKAAACEIGFVKPSKGMAREKNPINIGEIAGSPFYDPELRAVHLDYKMGAICMSNQTAETHYSTRITFRCVWGRHFTVPEFISVNGCRYEFLWLTDSACPRKSRAISEDGCSIRNEVFPVLFQNFSSISADDTALHFKTSSGYTFYVNVCKPLLDSPPYGAVLIDPHGNRFMLGKANDSIHRINELLYLEYKDGDVCPTNTRIRYSVIIRFICPSKESPLYLELVEVGECIYIFNLHTSLACSDYTRMCGVTGVDSRYYDFSYLKRRDGVSYDVDGEWNINICRGVKGCEGGKELEEVAVCRKGDPPSSLVSAEGYRINDRLQLLYEHGESCPDQPNRTLASIIYFKCHPNEYPGSPSKRIDTDPCEINFDFPTAIACSNITVPFLHTTSSCKIFNQVMRSYIDFSQLEPQTLEDGWVIKPCSKFGCAICQNGVSYGHMYSSHFDFHRKALEVHFKSGDECGPHKRRSSKLWFTCDPNLETGEELIRQIFSEPCHVEFEWRTRASCPPSVPYPAKIFSMKTLSAFGIVFAAGVAVILVLHRNSFLRLVCSEEFIKSLNEAPSAGYVLYSRGRGGSGYENIVSVPTLNRARNDDGEPITT